MGIKYDQFSTNRRILMGPGPSEVHPRVLNAMATPLIGHLDPQFLDIMDDIKSMVQATFDTRNNMSFVVSGPATTGMETCLINLLEPGDEALICINGVFGERMADMVERCGGVLKSVEAPWGKPIDPEDVRTALRSCKPKVIAIVHGETSTGVLQPLEEIAGLAKSVDALFVVDAVTTHCGVDLRMDDWEIDAMYAGTQKCLSAPPGLSPISMSYRATQAIADRKTKVQSWFMDLSLVQNYWAGSRRAYHHTGPVSAMFALHEAYRMVLEEGLENRYERHERNHLILKEGLEEMGLEFLVEEKYRLPMLNAVKIPDGVDDRKVRKQLLQDYNIEIGGGMGVLDGKIWRIGLMGESSSINHIHMLLSALKKIL